MKQLGMLLASILVLLVVTGWRVESLGRRPHMAMSVREFKVAVVEALADYHDIPTLVAKDLVEGAEASIEDWYSEGDTPAEAAEKIASSE